MSSRDTGRQAHKDADKASNDNRSRQLNRNNDAYWQSRGEDSRPSNWENQSDKKR